MDSLIILIETINKNGIHVYAAKLVSPSDSIQVILDEMEKHRIKNAIIIKSD